MTGTDSIREAEYRALMDQQRDSERTAQWSWTAAMLVSAGLFTNAITGRNPGLFLPVEFCVAVGFYATVESRRRTRLVSGYVQQFFEKERDGAQYHTRLAQLMSLPGAATRTDWAPLAVANAFTLMSVAFGWVFASGVAHGELMASLVTTLGMVFSVHSINENMRLDPPATAASWSQVDAGLREVPPVARMSSLR